MKNKYQRLTKEEKKQVKLDFKNESEKNKSYLGVLKRMCIYGIIGLIYGIASLLADIFILNVVVVSYIVDSIVLIFSVFLLVQRVRIENAVLNQYLIEKAKVEEAKKAAEPKKRKHVSKNAQAKKDAKKAEKSETAKTTKKTSTKKK